MKVVIANMFVTKHVPNKYSNTNYLGTNFSDIITNSSIAAQMCDKDGGAVHLRVNT